jgi:ubiquinone biosynthesis protein
VTASVVHVWRLWKWGRILARHGALKGIERDLNTPAPVRRLVRIVQIGVRVPKVPRYADAFQAIGPAAIKLGQTLATRPDLVGEVATQDLLRLQDQ